MSKRLCGPLFESTDMGFSLHSFPRAILHIDGDSFFASCEQAVNPALKGKPVVTGRERGIASSLSYDLKAMGVTRGMTLREIQKICPSVIIIPSDYETYSLFSKRMHAIVRRYTEAVEEYSIDECFADLTGMRRALRMSYIQMAERIKHDLESELGITFSLGLGPTKVLAKVCSKWNKPSGLTVIPASRIEQYLAKLPVGNVWGIGPQTTAYLKQYGIHTALAYAESDKEWIDAHMSKPYREIWQELRGEQVYPLILDEKHDYQSISKTKTFTPPSADKAFVFSQLSKNIENACIKARRHDLAPKKVFFFLKTQGFRYAGLELTLSARMSAPHEIIRLVQNAFPHVFREKTLYRATGVVLMDLSHEHDIQPDLFGAQTRVTTWQPVYAAVDMLDSKFGKHTVYLGSTHTALTKAQHANARADAPRRATQTLKGETARKRLALPLLGEV